jgi:hypothetical protein
VTAEDMRTAPIPLQFMMANDGAWIKQYLFRFSVKRKRKTNRVSLTNWFHHQLDIIAFATLSTLRCFPDSQLS